MKIVVNNKYTLPRRILLNKTLASKGRALLKAYLERGGITAEKELKQAFKRSKNTKKH